MNEAIKDEFEIRKEKLEKLNSAGIQDYPDKFKKTHSSKDALAEKEGTKNICIAGRIITKRTMGKISFAHILDDFGKIQLVFKDDEVGESEYKILFLGKALRPLPEKWHGLKDVEMRYRQRYLDIIANPDTKKVFEFRSLFMRVLREYYWGKGFIELETPILANTASGALAKPFKTHHNALNTDLYLRISAGEIWQKMAIIGGFEKTFDMGKVFRNEGMDPSHLQEFTAVEHYAAYWNFEDNMKFTEEMFSHLLKKLFGKMKIDIKNRKGETAEIDFTPPWPK
ncbi:MAG: Lysine-tRNA ligase, partial [Parcubacteria group bacterium GW2011_GWA2_38_13]